MASATRIRVLLADDHTVLRYMLRGILKQYPDIDIVGEATNGEDAVLMADKLQPAIVLMDINMPKLDGIEATQRIKANSIQIAVVGLSVHGEGYATDAMLRAGAVAVISKERAIEDLYDAIQRAITLPLDTSVRTDDLLKCRPEFILEQAPELNSDPM
jgi:DNA-binding NarL/FixJ family response regulator